MSVDPLLTAFAEETEATRVDLTRLRARIRAAESEASPGWSGLTRGLLLGGTGLLAAAAAAVFVLPLLNQPRPIAASFASTESAPVEVAPGVTLTTNGIGELSGTESAPRIALASGSVDVSVEPGAGLDVQVTTDEGTVRVVGTVFRVERSALGTTVSVTRGEVAVACSGQPDQSIAASQTTTCQPTSAAGLLGRARALPAGSAAVLDAVDAGLAMSPSLAIGTELSALRVDHLARTGQADAAIDAASAHLSDPNIGRRAEIARIGASLAYQRDGCAAVGPFLSELPDKELAASALSTCKDKAGTEP